MKDVQITYYCRALDILLLTQPTWLSYCPDAVTV